MVATVAPPPETEPETESVSARLDLIDLFNFHKKTPDSDKRSPPQLPGGYNCLSVRPSELAASSEFAISILEMDFISLF